MGAVVLAAGRSPQGGRFAFKDVFAWPFFSFGDMCADMVAACRGRKDYCDLYDLFATLSDIAFGQGNKLLGNYFNKWRVQIEDACRQNNLFVEVLIARSRGRKVSRSLAARSGVAQG